MSATANAAASVPKGGFHRFWRALKQLFHEVMAGVFAVLALAWVSAAFRAWSRDVQHWLTGIAAAMALLFVFFAVTSLRRARKL